MQIAPIARMAIRSRGSYDLQSATPRDANSRSLIRQHFSQDKVAKHNNHEQKAVHPMTRFMSAILAIGVILGLGRLAVADDQDASAVIDKAVKALGGAEKLGAAKSVEWKSKGKLQINDNDNKFNTKVTAQGITHFRQEFDGEFDGNPIKGVTIVAGDKGWRKIGDDSNKLEDDALTNEKRTVYLQIVPGMPQLLKGEGFKVEVGDEDKIGGKPAAVLKVTGPDGKDFQLFFDKESGLPVRMTATVVDFQGEEYKQDSAYSDFKDFDGIKRATKVAMKRNDKKFLDMEVTEFKVLDKVDAKTFAEPKGD
jgi:hypothetical protein